MKKEKYTVVIVDDQLEELEIIRYYISRLPFLELVAQLDDPLVAMKELDHLQPDLLLLDIQMPGVDGFRLLGTLTVRPEVIICSGHSDYAFEAFAHGVGDYIPKWMAFEAFEKVIRKAISRCDLATGHLNQHADLIRVLSADHRGGKVNIPIDKIIRLEVIDKETTFFCTDFNRKTRISLAGAEKLLPLYRFLRVHKSHLINIEKIKAYSSQNILLDGSDELVPIGLYYRTKVLDILDVNDH